MNYVYNKHTGEKIYFSHGMFCFRRIGCKDLGDALAKGWTFGSEDYEEPKEYWYISEQATVVKMANNTKDIPNFVSGCSSIGNLFETEEEAEKAVEKLKAWKRLKDKGVYFTRMKWLKKHLPKITKKQMRLERELADWFQLENYEERHR